MEHPGNSRVFLCYNKISPVKLSIKISCIASKIVYIIIIIIFHNGSDTSAVMSDCIRFPL